MSSVIRKPWFSRPADVAGRGWIIATRRALLALSLAALAGCSVVRLAYNQADTLLATWLDRQFDFDRAQSALVRDAATRWLAWQRRAQLPEMAATLAQVRRDWERPLTGADVCRWTERLPDWLDATWQQVRPDAVAVARQLGPAQWRHLEAHFARERREQAEDAASQTPAERRQAQVDRLAERYERLLGPLSAAQRERVGQLVDSQGDGSGWATERERQQQELLTTLRQLPALPVADATTVLDSLWARWRAGTPAQRMLREQTQQAHCQLLAELQASASPRQREHARRQWASWEADLGALVAQMR
ncbi:hypothetical protein KAK06_23225 [Ideonella sp. 4Y11]|uniref:Uncharacterized protein n=1 Tax=Ideonella aquatica TaxID=2824119 RepID=A0A940YLM0_9BURK|nr:DUF6279 family lipoprotein [Ideonella aquatica]MBQ0961869.1 hypothetical protein [Ideonella aquatica]